MTPLLPRPRRLGGSRVRRSKAAADRPFAAREEVDRQPVIDDWHCRMMLEEALIDLWLANRDLTQARPEAERLLALTLATTERTWQARAWDINARIALAERDLQRAQRSIDHALSTMEGFEGPLAAWRVHGTAAALYGRAKNHAASERHRALARATILGLSNSLGADDPLRDTFLSAPSVCSIVDPS